jgi:hypothetical protein
MTLEEELEKELGLIEESFIVEAENIFTELMVDEKKKEILVNIIETNINSRKKFLKQESDVKDNKRRDEIGIETETNILISSLAVLSLKGVIKIQ